jgi:hypothetical protein
MEISTKNILGSNAEAILSSLINLTQKSEPEIVSNISEIAKTENSFLLDNFLKNENKFGVSEIIDLKGNDPTLNIKKGIKHNI